MRQQHAFGLKLITGPAAEPVTVADVKARARVDGSADDIDLAALIASAREQCEIETGRAFVTQTWSLVLDRFPRWRGEIHLPRPPLQSVTWVKYYDLNGVLQTLDSSVYMVGTAREPGRIGLVWNQIWPFVQWGRIEGVEIRFVAGYTAVPAAACDAIRIMVADRYANRWANDRGIPPAARRLLDTLDHGHQY